MFVRPDVAAITLPDPALRVILSAGVDAPDGPGAPLALAGHSTRRSTVQGGAVMSGGIVSGFTKPLLNFVVPAAHSGAAAALATAVSVGVCGICCIPTADTSPMQDWATQTGPAAGAATQQSTHDGTSATSEQARVTVSPLTARTLARGADVRFSLPTLPSVTLPGRRSAMKVAIRSVEAAAPADRVAVVRTATANAVSVAQITAALSQVVRR
jgi:hypothetical protein